MSDALNSNNQVLNPEMIAEKGEQIYKDKLKEKLEDKHKGEFVAIDIDSEKYFLGDSPEAALKKATQKFPSKIFHLIRIGHLGVYKVSWSAGSNKYGWVF
jgi:hypothetical protein